MSAISDSIALSIDWSNRIVTENPRVAVSLSNGNVAVVNVDSALSLSIDREFVAHDLFGEPTEVFQVSAPTYDYFFF